MTETEAFTIVEPDGKTYRIWADGRVEGFAEPAIINNRIPSLMRLTASQKVPHDRPDT